MKPATLSHWINETTPERVRDVLHRANIDADEFARRVGPELGAYRSREHVKASIPQPSAEADFAQRLAERIADVADLLGRRAMPPRTHALMLHALHFRLGEDWNALRERLLRDLQIAQAALPIVARELREKPGTRGRKVAASRAELLAAIRAELSRQLGPRRGRVAALALEVLRAYGIAAPSPDQADPTKAAKRATRVKGRK